MVVMLRRRFPGAAWRALLIALCLCASTAWGQSNRREPRLGYLYPAGGRQGSVFWVTVGGQYLRGVSDLHVTGEGVKASKVRYMGPFRRLNREQRLELQRRIEEIREKLGAGKSRKDRGPARRGDAPGRGRDRRPPGKGKAAPKADPVKLPNHPVLNKLEELSLRELEFVENRFLRVDRRMQPNAQLGDMALIEVSIDADAAPGDREIRLVTPQGLTNPMCFQVGILPEISEPDPFDPRPGDTPPVDLPVRMNGQIRPGDVDRFSFRAEAGQRLLIEAHARRLVPYLADAVPGWFQATLALYDSRDREVAFVDDYRLGPDPILFYEIPESGTYKVEIRDAIYRGREDFVYRITVGERPFIKSIFPLGAREGAEKTASIEGWNLGRKRLPLDTRPGGRLIREAALQDDGGLTNTVEYAVDDVPEIDEVEPNDAADEAQEIDLPRTVNGRIGAPGDEDVFRFEGRAGDEIVAEVIGRRLHSSIDSLLRLTDAEGGLLAWNDDHCDKDGYLHREMGLITHQADSYLRLRLPEDGVYLIRLSDSQHQGGDACGYRLRVGPPRPDFALRLAPSSINVHAGTSAVFSVHALRKDGFDGDIELRLKDAPAGFKLRGARIPAGRDRVRLTLTAPGQPTARPVSIQVEGYARIGGREVVRPAVPSEDMMQAFLYRHLVPSRELLVLVIGRAIRSSPAELAADLPVRIPAGGTARAEVKIRRPLRLENIEFVLSDPPEGVLLENAAVSPGLIELVLKSSGDAKQIGLADNLIVEAFMEREIRRQGGKPTGRKQRVSLGVLPAIPFEIVQP